MVKKRLDAQNMLDIARFYGMRRAKFMPAGYSTDHPEALAEAICLHYLRVSEGESMASICREEAWRGRQ